MKQHILKSKEELYPIEFQDSINKPKKWAEACWGGIDYANLFVYMYRRFGPPFGNGDDYKDLASWLIDSSDPEIIILFRFQGYGFISICPFSNKKLERQAFAEMWKPGEEYKQRMKAWGKPKGFTYSSAYPMFPAEIKAAEKDYADNFLKTNPVLPGESNGNTKAYMAWRNEENTRLFDAYEAIEPKTEETYTPDVTDAKKYPVLNRVWQACMAAFEDMKTPTFIRDTYLNCNGKYPETWAIEEPAPYFEFAGYSLLGVAEELKKAAKIKPPKTAKPA